jgi:hypothetical protein
VSELAVVTPQQRVTLADKISFAKALAASNLLPRQYQGNPANLLFALEYAEALRISPINAITSIHVIEGKPSASADLIAALVRRAGHKLRVTGDDRHAVAQIVRVDDPGFVFEVEWTLERAKVAGLTGKGVWRQYPAAMLRSRAITEVARAAASDALFGIVYTPEELGAPSDDDDPPARPVRSVPDESPVVPLTEWGERIADERFPARTPRTVNVSDLAEVVGTADPVPPADSAARPDRPAAPKTVADRGDSPARDSNPEPAPLSGESVRTRQGSRVPPPIPATLPLDELPANDDPPPGDDVVVEDEPLITEGQRARLMSNLNALGAREHDVRVRWLSDVLERTVESSSDLTVTEASAAIDAAQAELAQRDRDARGGRP